MVSHSQEDVSGHTMNIFRCERCKIFEATEAEKPHYRMAVEQQAPRARSIR